MKPSKKVKSKDKSTHLTLRFNRDLRQIVLTFGGVEFSILASPLLTTVLNIVDYTDGFITFKTNYGNEYIDLNELIESLSSDTQKIYINALSSIKEVVYKKGVEVHMSKNKVKEIFDAAYLVLDGLAFGYITQQSTGVRHLKVIDLHNLKYEATFILTDDLDFNMAVSSFPNGKRKYEAMFLVERNKESLLKGLKNA